MPTAGRTASRGWSGPKRQGGLADAGAEEADPNNTLAWSPFQDPSRTNGRWMAGGRLGRGTRGERRGWADGERPWPRGLATWIVGSEGVPGVYQIYILHAAHRLPWVLVVFRVWFFRGGIPCLLAVTGTAAGTP